ncbi:Paraquat-inducible protein A [compost metagenome]|uniref:paraquat-inducible protein A n=1 Tax=Pseudomonas TaxID=286 RepID=UPI0003F8FA3D|nr:MULTISPECIES: paraquat-inducible protein A [Pseudomonas]MCW2271315.1 paraquat-inducible protein A [Pseudomonas sp. JUb96]PRA71319.1 paraquat-inducible protein A [Pseudomonas sp. MYb187]
MNRPPLANELNLVLCHACGKACDTTAGPVHECPRCGAPVHERKPNSLTRTWAYLIAALVFYIPANLLPVMNTKMLGSADDSTIMSGVIEFWAHGAWDIASIIFIASIAVPATKFVALGLLLITVQRGSDWAQKERSKLYRFVELIGYWSMLDVIVVALVAALVKFQALGDIEPRPGILFFGLVVVFTMLAAMSFDPRMIWESPEPKERMDEVSSH